MEIPYGGLVSSRLVEKRFKMKVFYFLTHNGTSTKYLIKSGLLRFGPHDINSPAIRYFDSNMNLGPCAQHVNWSEIYESLESAEVQLRSVKSLYNDGFDSVPFIRLHMLQKIKPDLIKIQDDIKRCLPWKGDNSTIRFTDVSAGGIQVNGNYAGKTILYDLSNKHDVVIDFVESATIFKSNYNNHH